MKTDVNGICSCPAGGEQWEEVTAFGDRYVKYYYRKPTGLLFTTIADNLAQARAARDAWLELQPR